MGKRDSDFTKDVFSLARVKVKYAERNTKLRTSVTQQTSHYKFVAWAVQSEAPSMKLTCLGLCDWNTSRFSVDRDASVVGQRLVDELQRGVHEVYFDGITVLVLDSCKAPNFLIKEDV